MKRKKVKIYASKYISIPGSDDFLYFRIFKLKKMPILVLYFL
ncbi:hypothetical protein SAMN05421594_3208 [Chryseobacterium oleae]|uniref:Uncharacterized protein n=1 Tax=Chryseobacterium oleae TaxID=491207 RepID=A0A1I4ZT50_CHROL|nr:hypothetical protein SAMN05421594_3208 [Chryseobacterium oleae]